MIHLIVYIRSIDIIQLINLMHIRFEPIALHMRIEPSIKQIKLNKATYLLCLFTFIQFFSRLDHISITRK